jgi:hypothetical protein
MNAVAHLIAATEQPTGGAEPALEPVFVFGSSIAGKHVGDTAAHALKFHGAQMEQWNGPTGNTYALPFRSSDLRLLPLDVIGTYVRDFLRYAAEHPEVTFSITRFGCGEEMYQDAVMAELFRDAPRNCQLPGIWARSLDPSMPVRLLISDPAAYMKTREWQRKLFKYLSRNAALWEASAVELVSSGLALSVVANDVAARNLGLRHCIVSCNQDYYRELTPYAAELKAIWFSTHLLCISDFARSAQPNQVRITAAASRGGLHIEHLDVRDPTLEVD